MCSWQTHVRGTLRETNSRSVFTNRMGLFHCGRSPKTDCHDGMAMVWVQPLCADKTFRTCRSFTIDVHTKRDKCLPCGRTVCRYQPIIESLTYRCMRMQVTGAARRATIEKRKKKYSIKKGFRAAQLVFCPWGRVFRAVPPGEAKRESHYHMLSLFARGSLQGLGTLETPRTTIPFPGFAGFRLSQLLASELGLCRPQA